MIQRGENPRFAFESRNTIRISSEGFRKKLDGNAAAKFRIRRLIDIPHAPGTQVRVDFVMCEFRADHVRAKTPETVMRILSKLGPENFT